jgi:hypothetical protein
MKKVFALLFLAVCAMPVVAGAQASVDAAKLLGRFSSPLKTDGGTFQVVVLNDRTVEALFPDSPAKIAIRTRARMATVLFIQGNVAKDFEFDPAVKVEQKGKTLDGKGSSLQNFKGGKVSKGQPIQGMVELPEKLDLYSPFKVTMSGSTTEFRLNEDDVREFGNR